MSLDVPPSIERMKEPRSGSRGC